jgi:hypothetical protein
VCFFFCTCLRFNKGTQNNRKTQANKGTQHNRKKTGTQNNSKSQAYKAVPNIERHTKQFRNRDSRIKQQRNMCTQNSRETQTSTKEEKI